MMLMQNKKKNGYHFAHAQVSTNNCGSDKHSLNMWSNQLEVQITCIGSVCILKITVKRVMSQKKRDNLNSKLGVLFPESSLREKHIRRKMNQNSLKYYSGIPLSIGVNTHNFVFSGKAKVLGLLMEGQAVTQMKMAKSSFKQKVKLDFQSSVKRNQMYQNISGSVNRFIVHCIKIQRDQQSIYLDSI